LKKKKKKKKEKPLKIGQLLQCVILNEPKGRVVNISVSPQAVVKAEVISFLSFPFIRK